MVCWASYRLSCVTTQIVPEWGPGQHELLDRETLSLHGQTYPCPTGQASTLQPRQSCLITFRNGSEVRGLAHRLAQILSQILLDPLSAHLNPVIYRTSHREVPAWYLMCAGNAMYWVHGSQRQLTVQGAPSPLLLRVRGQRELRQVYQ